MRSAGPRWVRATPVARRSQRSRAVTRGNTKVQVIAPSRLRPRPLRHGGSGFESPPGGWRGPAALANEAGVSVVEPHPTLELVLALPGPTNVVLVAVPDPRTGQRSERSCSYSRWFAGNLLATGRWKEAQEPICAGGRDRFRTCGLCRVKAYSLPGAVGGAWGETTDAQVTTLPAGGSSPSTLFRAQ
jgi:hypothetical protein